MQTKTADDYRELADAKEQLADKLSNADSIAEDCPVMSDLFNEVRTSNHRSRDGRHVALFDYDPDDGWSCRNVSFLQSGTHYRDTGADMSLSFKPYPFLSVKEFRQHMRAEIMRQAKAARQTAGNIEEQKRQSERRKEIEGY